MKSSSDHLVIRALSYNIHACVNAYRRVSVSNICRILKQLNADIIALQEVDGHTRLSSRPDQASIIGEKLNLNHVCFATDAKGLHAFGLAVLTRFDIVDVHFDWLPRLYPKLGLRRRGALRATMDTPMGRIHVVNTHLSVYKLEAWMQAKALLAGDWFAGIGVDQPVILCGDLNAGPFSGVYRTLARQFTDVQTLSGVGLTPEPTFHARSTHWRIDHIFVSGPIRPIAVEVPRDAEIRMSSDHLPLVANLTIDGGSDGDVPNSAISSKAAE